MAGAHGLAGPELTMMSSDAEICQRHPFELYCKFPALSPFYTQFEKTFSGDDAAAWCLDRLYIPITLAVLYLLALRFGQHCMADRAPFNLKALLAYWNLGLSVFSGIAVTRVVPHLLYYLFTEGPHFSVCHRAELWFGNGVVGFWSFMFVMSKIPELLDTAFIILRKRKLIFLHWYHHTSVLLLTWYGGATKQSAALWFMSMNYSVHSIMYFYYYLSAIGKRVSWAPFVTTIQIAQMFAGVTITLKIELTRRSGVPCAITPGCHAFTCLIYASYLYLFCRFAWYRFGPGKSAKVAAGGSSRGKVEAPTATGASTSGPPNLTRRVKGEPGLAGGDNADAFASTNGTRADPSATPSRLGDLEAGVAGPLQVPRVKQRLD